MIIITAGQTFTDIDVLACSFAYQELMSLLGKKAKVVIPGPYNSTIPAIFRKIKMESHYNGDNKQDQFIVIDVSNPEYIANFVNQERIIEIYDHRKGFIEYWQKKLGKVAKVELVGACATLIWEKFKEQGQDERISKLCANLLYATILSHTGNFKASVTTERDREAVREIKKYTDLPTNWIDQYFREVSGYIMENPLESLENDSKVIRHNGQDIFIAQLEMWDAKDFIAKYEDKIMNFLRSRNISIAFVNLISMSEEATYQMALNEESKKFLTKLMNLSFKNNISQVNRILKRKEIMGRINEIE
jgi:inorganic pyrophosphatase